MTFDSKKQKYIFYYFPAVLFSLIPFFLITGPFLSDLSISLITIIFLVYCLKKKQLILFHNKYFYFFIIFWGYLLINTFINNFNIDSLKISFFYFRYGVFVIAIVTLLNYEHSFKKYFFYCIFVCFIILIFDGFYQYFKGHNIIGLKSESYFRVTSFFGDEQILGSYLSRIWPIFFGLAILILNKKNKLFLLFILVFILSEALIFLTGDRSAFFYINLSAFFVILFSKNLIRLRLLTLFSSLVILVIISHINPTAKERIFDQTLDQMNLINKNKDDDKYNQIFIFTKEHHEIYISAYKMFLDNKVLGVGVKNYRNLCNDPKYFVNDKVVCYSHPHNTYLQLLSETGLIGLSFLLVVLFNFTKYLIKHLNLKFKSKYYYNDFEICILSGIIIYLWPFIPTGNIFSNWLNIAMILNLPFLIWSRKSKKKKN